MWALGIGMGLSSIMLSLHYRMPILTAWSTPGAALLATGLNGVPMAQAIGAFLFASALIAIAGASGWFERLMHHVPRSLAAALLGGVLLRFGIDVFVTLPSQGWIVGTMLVCFLLARRFLPRYAVPLTLLAGLIVTVCRGEIHASALALEFARPMFTVPAFSITTLIGVGLPLFIVTMASQNVPGLAVLRANGYQPPASPLIGWTGFTGLLLGAFGGYAYNLAAITAAICMTKDADTNPAKRYRAAIWAGGFYLIAGLFGATIAGLFAAFPNALVLAIAGLALLSTIGNSLATALGDEKERDAALITFLASASGFSLWGIGSAFWALLLGLLAAKLTRH